MNEPNKSVMPERPEPTWEIEEIVSPVQPKKPAKPAKWLFLVVCLLIITAGAYGAKKYYNQHHLDKTPAVSVQEHPETPEPVIVTEKPLPSVVVTDSLPTPRISSTYTDVPSTSAGSVMGHTSTSAQVYKNYSNPTYGFTVRLQDGLHAITREQGSTAIVEYLDKQNSLAFRADIIGTFGQTLGDVKESLLLSPEISSIDYKTVNGQELLSYNVDKIEAFAIVKNNFIYYLTDYTGNALDTFVLR